MSPENLPSDPDSLEKWKHLPQNTPSREALPPAAGGARWIGLLLILSILIVLALLLQNLPK